MNKVKKIFMIALILILFMCSDTFAVGDILGIGEQWETDGEASALPDGTAVDVTINDLAIKSVSRTVYNIAFSIGIVVVFTVGAMLGIKFIVTGVEEKAEVKETLFPYLISCVVFFGAFGIWRLAVNVLGHLV